ncbi:MAG: histidine kinase [Thermobacillus sp. ZCTH02-B1]|uniref:cache domain-containing sensor histidine kinase n=1 Tax=Thermobacillus sp. ZCTH02-B1 TaxID=1858795 RepID=UPI000B57C22C|nr:sensor histidine kinase [Thermobacillus sp. ZCTH02-B1]OUM95266.1 MAG: histidine kinase [Thermobacillus sp. ZCTH02-B1]
MRVWLEINNWPIRYKLIALFLLIGILPAICIGVLIHFSVDRVLERQAVENTLQLIAKVNRSLEHYAVSLQNITYMVSDNPDVRRFLDGTEGPEAKANDHYEIRQLMRTIGTLYTEVAGILIAGSTGESISNELYVREGYRLSREPWYEEAVRRDGIFTIVGRPEGRQVASHVNYRDDEVISVARAVLDPDTQNVLGVVLIDLKLRVIAQELKNVRLGRNGYLMVIDSEGEPVYAPSNLPISSVRPDWFGGTSGSVYRDTDSGRFQFIYVKSPFTGWTTIGVFPARESIPEMREIQFYIVSFVFLVCLFGIAASYYLSRTISRPIGQLISFMQKAESGDLLTRFIGERHDEIGMLGRSFNRMLVQINRLISLMKHKERQKREAELRSLQAHIRPHFLYNTLDTIQWMARREGAAAAAEVAESLARLFRIGLSGGRDRIPLAEEFEHLESYLKIQKVRYRDKLNYSIRMEPGLERYTVMKLILQPLVENSIYHGIKERRGPGTIEVDVSLRDGDLVLRVRDDGVGMDEARLAEVRRALDRVGREPDPGELITEAESAAADGSGSRDRGFGLINVHERLRLTFGERYGLVIDSARGEGTTVTVIHPALPEDTAACREEEGP